MFVILIKKMKKMKKFILLLVFLPTFGLAANYVSQNQVDINKWQADNPTIEDGAFDFLPDGEENTYDNAFKMKDTIGGTEYAILPVTPEHLSFFEGADWQTVYHMPYRDCSDGISICIDEHYYVLKPKDEAYRSIPDFPYNIPSSPFELSYPDSNLKNNNYESNTYNLDLSEQEYKIERAEIDEARFQRQKESCEGSGREDIQACFKIDSTQTDKKSFP